MCVCLCVRVFSSKEILVLNDQTRAPCVHIQRKCIHIIWAHSFIIMYYVCLILYIMSCEYGTACARLRRIQGDSKCMLQPFYHHMLYVFNRKNVRGESFSALTDLK